LRLSYIYPDHIVLGYDQMVDLFSARKIVEYHDLVVQESELNSLGINHGVLFSYFTAIFYFLGRGNPVVIAMGYVGLHLISLLTVYFFILLLFKDKLAAFIGVWLFTISWRLILMAGWISLTTAGLFATPLFYLGFWYYAKGRKRGLLLSAFSLGLLIQSQWLMLYQLLTIPLVWLGLRLRFPKVKTFVGSVVILMLTLSTLIVAEIKTNFSTVKIFMNPAGRLDEVSMPLLGRTNLLLSQYLTNFSDLLFPYAGLIILPLFIWVLVRNWRTEKKSLFILLIFIFSPLFMVGIGYHDQPWSLLATYPAIIILTGYTLSKILERRGVLILLFFITLFNLSQTIIYKKSDTLFIPQEASSTLKGQLAVVDYTYHEAGGQSFTINAVSYPLYRDLYWSYHYPTYGLHRYGYLPGWIGGDQLYPCDALPKATADDNIIFMIIDETRAIPALYKNIGKEWGNDYGKLIKEVKIGGFTVQKFVRYEK